VSQNYYALFGLNPTFNIELATLESNYRKIQSESHPDRFVTASAAEKLNSMQLATLANEAYQCLKNPANRAKYLLELQGITAISETNTAMPTDFLMQQMEWRERLEEAKQAKNIGAIEALECELKAEAIQLQADFTMQFDTKKDYGIATEIARKLTFIDKVSADISKAIENLDV
jgi:molecular chaperone HscB